MGCPYLKDFECGMGRGYYCGISGFYHEDCSITLFTEDVDRVCKTEMHKKCSDYLSGLAKSVSSVSEQLD